MKIAAGREAGKRDFEEYNRGGTSRVFCRLQDAHRRRVPEAQALYRMGLITTTDGGRTFAYRRAA